MSKRVEAALEVLRAGGYWRMALESAYHGGERFKYRLRTKGGAVVAGFGFQTHYAMEQAGMLQGRACAPSSTWPEEWELAARLQGVGG
jgi:hypothetical protein